MVLFQQEAIKSNHCAFAVVGFQVHQCTGHEYAELLLAFIIDDLVLHYIMFWYTTKMQILTFPQNDLNQSHRFLKEKKSMLKYSLTDVYHFGYVPNWLILELNDLFNLNIVS